MRYRLRETPEAIVAGLRAQVESEVHRLSVRTLGPRTRLRLLSGPRVTVPAFEVGVVDLYFGHERELTSVRVRTHHAWRWWTVSVRAPAGIISVLVDLAGLDRLTGDGLTQKLGRGVDAAHERQARDQQRLIMLVVDYLGERDVGVLGGDPFRSPW